MGWKSKQIFGELMDFGPLKKLRGVLKSINDKEHKTDTPHMPLPRDPQVQVHISRPEQALEAFEDHVGDNQGHFMDPGNHADQDKFCIGIFLACPRRQGAEVREWIFKPKVVIQDPNKDSHITADQERFKGWFLQIVSRDQTRNLPQGLNKPPESVVDNNLEEYLDPQEEMGTPPLKQG